MKLRWKYEFCPIYPTWPNCSQNIYFKWILWAGCSSQLHQTHGSISIDPKKYEIFFENEFFDFRPGLGWWNHQKQNVLSYIGPTLKWLKHLNTVVLHFSSLYCTILQPDSGYISALNCISCSVLETDLHHVLALMKCSDLHITSQLHRSPGKVSRLGPRFKVKFSL